jgi:hypothetical protein
MSNHKKVSQQKKNVLISSKEIEQFKLMLDNFGNDLTALNTNYQQLLECKYFYFNFLF